MTQGERVLKTLKDANGEWVSGRHFLHTMLLSQYHTRIHELQKKGYKIIPSDFTDEYGFKSYKLEVERPPQVLPQYRKDIISQRPLFTSAQM